MTYETRGVVVTDGLGVTEGFQYGIGLYDLVLQGSLLLGAGVLLGRGTDGREVRDYLLRVLGLSGSRFSGDQHRLILAVCFRQIGGNLVISYRGLSQRTPSSGQQVALTGQHVDVGTVGDGEDVGWDLATPLTTVQFGTTMCVHRVSLVGIDGHTEKTGVCLQIFLFFLLSTFFSSSFFERYFKFTFLQSR